MGPARSHCATLLRVPQHWKCIVFIYTSAVEAQAQLTAAVEKERSSTEKALTLQSRVTHLEKQSASLRQEKSRLAASLELEKAKAETFEESQQRCVQ